MTLVTLDIVKGVGQELCIEYDKWLWAALLRLLQVKEGTPLSKMILKHLGFLAGIYALGTRYFLS